MVPVQPGWVQREPSAATGGGVDTGDPPVAVVAVDTVEAAPAVEPAPAVGAVPAVGPGLPQTSQ